MQDYNKTWTREIIFWRLQMLLVGFTVWGIVCLKHSWKAMWTRLADWAAMSNSLPQRKDEPLCGLQRLARLCGCSHVHTHVWGPAENKFTFFTFRTRLSRRSSSPSSSPVGVQGGKEGVSVRSEWHTWNPSADVTVSELRETRALSRVCGQGPSFRDSTGRSFSMHFSLLHFISST